ncbi:hypothetical protein PRIPAC_87730 [Pristionchus pacificus]|nr:hypothetical protein PRIPAC_87730 [Pristionchus pacificus]
MNTTELDPIFKAFLVNYHHVSVVRGVIVFIANSLVSIVIIMDKDSRATTYRSYLLALQITSMTTDSLLDAYTPFILLNSHLVFSDSFLAQHLDIVVLPAGSRFCWVGCSRYSLFIGLQVNVAVVTFMLVIVIISARVPAKDVPEDLSWLCSMPSFGLLNASPYFYTAAAYAGSIAVFVFGSLVLMIWDVQRELRRGIKHASGATQRLYVVRSALRSASNAHVHAFTNDLSMFSII